MVVDWRRDFYQNFDPHQVKNLDEISLLHLQSLFGEGLGAKELSKWVGLDS